MKTRWIILLAICINLLLSYAMLLYNQPINIDGTLYLLAAKNYLSQGLHGALKVYPWPFYSILIAKTSRFFHMNLLNTGFILNGFFTSLLVVFFLLSLKTFQTSSKTLLWGAAVILLFPALNHDRFNILRDIPYYSLFICSLWCYIKLLQTEKFYYGILWQIIILSATLFRIEGTIFLLTIPVITLFVPARQITIRLARFIKLCGLMIFMGIIGLIYIRHLFDFGRIPDLITNLEPHLLFAAFQTKIIQLRSYLGVLGSDAAGTFLIGGLISLLLSAVITTLGIFSTLLLLYGVYTKTWPENKSALFAIFSYIVINLIILSAFISHMLFMNWRYVFPLVLICLLFLPLILEKLFHTTSKIRWLAVIYLIYLGAGSFGQFGPSNSYIVEAGNWIATNTPVNTQLYSNDALTVFYAQRSETQNPNAANYIAIVSKIHAPSSLPAGKTPIAQFQNRRGDTAYIYNNTLKK